MNATTTEITSTINSILSMMPRETVIERYVNTARGYQNQDAHAEFHSAMEAYKASVDSDEAKAVFIEILENARDMLIGLKPVHEEAAKQLTDEELSGAYRYICDAKGFLIMDEESDVYPEEAKKVLLEAYDVALAVINGEMTRRKEV